MRISRTLACLCFSLLSVSTPVSAAPYDDLVEQNPPALRWTFENGASATALDTQVRGKVTLDEAGPRPSEYPDFSPTNRGARFSKGPNYLVVTDPGDNSPIDFGLGDSLTLEAWIRIDGNLAGTYPYLIGKGRTHNLGTNFMNQNYSLRLATSGGGTAISFFFADADCAKKKGTDFGDDGHRWTSTGFVPDDGAWHHVAVTYTFGKKDSLKGYIDGDPVPGKWDMGGPTDEAPMTDNDELWIGSSMGGGASFEGLMDEVAIHRQALTPEAIRKRVNIHLAESPYAVGKVRDDSPIDHVAVEIVEKVPVARKWGFRVMEPQPLYRTDVFALKRLPLKYDNKGLIVDRAIPSLLHLHSSIEFAQGEYEFLLRSLDAARLYIDGELVAETGFMNLNSDAHQKYYELPDYGDNLLSLAAGQQERRVKVPLTAGRHQISLYRLVGNKNQGDYLGEMTVGITRDGQTYSFLAPQRELPYTDAGWLTFLDEDRRRLTDWNYEQRNLADSAEKEYWTKRHAWAATQAGSPVAVPDVPHDRWYQNEIDAFILAKLRDSGEQPTSLISDWEFLRRATLDLIGTIPTPDQVQLFFADPVETRRSKLIDRLLSHEGWADHWVTYWQDVLAENPGLTKPELNNSGPFRWYLHDAFRDNRSIDRIATELVMMEGSTYSGGPAGFSVASQNEVPMAAKAHILGAAFLAVEMKCARCHDAPYHDVLQGDLFALAAMLKRGEEKVPGSSGVLMAADGTRELTVKVTLAPGSAVKPAWPFGEFVNVESEQLSVPGEFLRNPGDTRELLAATLTSPYNNRFARVIANRMWKRFLGRGLIEPIADWEQGECSHPELLDYLAQQLVLHHYDLKAISRLILNSHVYQRQAVPGIDAGSSQAALFRGPVRRKMTGEQVADSLFLAVGKPFGTEELTIDLDAKMPDRTFGHLGVPQRSWEFAAVSNERDRPSMSLPIAQSLIDLMSAYGWRQQRQDPVNDREDPLTALQPLALGNGTAANRAIDFSDGSALTELALTDQPVEQFVERLVERLLTRPATSEERQMFVDLLREGYDTRITAGPEAVPPKRIFRTGITWISHFDPKADDEAIARQRAVLHGDPPSVRLAADWRARAEDVAWTLVNSPEFVFVP